MATVVKDLTPSLVSHLKDSGLDAASLRLYSSTIAKASTHGISWEKIWKLGKPAVDGLLAKGRLQIADVAKLKDILVLPNINGIEIFPIGIINPEAIDIRVKIGPKTQQF